MYKAWSKDIIENVILSHLSTAKRGFETKSCLVEVINSILYKPKIGIQWHVFPVESLFSNVVLNYKTVYWYCIIPNTAVNVRNGSSDEIMVFDETLYAQRYTIEKTNACMDGYRTSSNCLQMTVIGCILFDYVGLWQCF